MSIPLLRRLFLSLLFIFFTSPYLADAQSGTLSNGINGIGALANMTARDYWTFNSVGGGYWALSVGSTDGAGTFAITVTQPDGTRNNTGGLDSQHSTSMAGTYTVSVRRTDSGTMGGAYSLSLTMAPDPYTTAPNDEGSALTNNYPSTGSAWIGDRDMWTFKAQDGDNYSVTITSGGMTVVRPDGSILNTGSSTAWHETASITGTYTVMVGNSSASSSGVGYSLLLKGASLSPPPPSDKNLGDVAKNTGCGCQDNKDVPTAVADPISLATGNLFETVSDYATAGANPLAFTRYYNSQGSMVTAPLATMLGVNWRSNFDRYIRIISPTTIVQAERADGAAITFASTDSGATWKPDADIDIKLTVSGSTWTLTDADDTVETYTNVSATEALLNTIKLRNGYTQTPSYTGTQLNSVKDSYGRVLSFTYSGGLLNTVTTPDSLVLTYGFGASGTSSRLTSVSYNTTPATSQAYLYENSSFPFALTGITDEIGNRYTTWSYDTHGRATSSQHAGGAGYTQIAYDDATGNRTVTNPLGEQETYKFNTIKNVAKVVEIDRAATATVPAATRTFAYDANGYVNGATDWNGIYTAYTNNAHGRPTAIYHAYGSPNAYTTTIVYDKIWVHLPYYILEPGIETDYYYEAGTGNLLTKNLYDTLSSKGTYSASERSWAYTWNNFLLATVQNPRTDLTAAARTTTYGYDASGALTSITNGLGQATTITAHTGGGRPKTIVDPNGVKTILAYSPRQWLLSSSVATAGGARTTALTYDAAGNLASRKLPDNSLLTNTYDAAQRLTKVTDLLSGTQNYTLDAMGHPTAILFKGGTTTRYQHADRYDTLGRVLVDTRGTNRQTTYGYDGNGNTTSIIDPDKHPAAAQVFDALNRMTQMTDPARGITHYTYDAHDRPLSVTAPNGAVTTYTYDGYGDVGKEVSADRGTTTYHYDEGGNLTRKTDALAVVANYTYDALNRRLTTAYPAPSTENVAYTYDQAGHGFGVGRLTSMADQAGSLSRSYDERGNLTSETRTRGTVKLTTSYAYDAASRIATITYPDGAIVAQTRNTRGNITDITVKPSATGTAQYVVHAASNLPFGPVSSLYHGTSSQISESRVHDLDYRITSVASILGATTVDKLTYVLDSNGNPTGVTDAVTAANNQTLTYDNLDRLLTASGAYGAESFGYDANGNRTAAGSQTNTYTANTNRLTALGSQAVTTNANGNITNIAYATEAGFTYNKANRLATVTSGGGTVLSYLYDGFGQRITKTDTAQRFEQYDQDGHLIEITDNLGNVQLDYIYLDSLPVATFVPSGTSGTVSVLLTDRTEQPLLATSLTGTVGWSHTAVDPFGAPSAVSGNTLSNDLRFPGQEYEAASGHNHNGWRDYAPALGRYVQMDPSGLAGGLNTYAYANNSPGRFVDRRGLYVTVTLYQGAAGAGHIGVGVNSTTTKGFYGVGTGFQYVTGSKLVGVMHTDNGVAISSVIIPTTADQDAKILAAQQAIADSPNPYDLYGPNCATTANGELRAGGIDLPPTIMPRNLFSEAQKAVGLQEGLEDDGMNLFDAQTATNQLEDRLLQDAPQ